MGSLPVVINTGVVNKVVKLVGVCFLWWSSKERFLISFSFAFCVFRSHFLFIPYAILHVPVPLSCLFLFISNSLLIHVLFSSSSCPIHSYPFPVHVLFMFIHFFSRPLTWEIHKKLQTYQAFLVHKSFLQKLFISSPKSFGQGYLTHHQKVISKGVVNKVWGLDG